MNQTIRPLMLKRFNKLLAPASLLLVSACASSPSSYQPASLQEPGVGEVVHRGSTSERQAAMDRLQAAFSRNVRANGSCKIEVNNVPDPETGDRTIATECIGDSEYERQVMRSLRTTRLAIPRFRTIVWTQGYESILNWNERIGNRSIAYIGSPTTDDPYICLSRVDGETLADVSVSTRTYESISPSEPDTVVVEDAPMSKVAYPAGLIDLTQEPDALDGATGYVVQLWVGEDRPSDAILDRFGMSNGVLSRSDYFGTVRYRLTTTPFPTEEAAYLYWSTLSVDSDAPDVQYVTALDDFLSTAF
ncbi:hypothetical protein RM531_08705 [Salinisphaera sp. P385]|uniref:Uncharacterized protein n=1 Tax=Spectribacter acetivorans TaxID=3075603 RepID=A0ABU3B9S3_9GAMM|nr:hypothetical protein [Salinisphaera sp. P385]MDT0618557.1 hypothetical protein [Salinisphaera sp. P385]